MKVSSNKIVDIYNHYLNRLKVVYSEKESSILLKRLMAHFIDSQPYQIPFVDSDKRVSESKLLQIHFAVKDLLVFKPLEYILGFAKFYEHDFLVNENVLIPRPETEELVDYIWKNKNLFDKKPRGLDIGTGSGCIPIMLSKLFDVQMFSCDISQAAISIAEKNKKLHAVDIQFINIDFLNSSFWNLLPLDLDFIVSNPPYVRESEKVLMEKNVLNYEPHLALFVENSDPLIFYRQIHDFALLALKSKGHLFLEINEFLSYETADLFINDFSDIFIIKDLNDKPRFLHVIK
jgi:release factor glutamine methyltransferase